MATYRPPRRLQQSVDARCVNNGPPIRGPLFSWKRPQWTACLADLRPDDTLIIWKIDRLGRNLRDLVDIVTTLGARGVGVKSLTNGIIDTTTAHGKLVFGMFALMAEYEAALIAERTHAGLAAARARGRNGVRKPKMTPKLVDKAQRM